MSVSLLLEHVHGDPCPVVHAAVMSNRQRPGVRPCLRRWRGPPRRSARSPVRAPPTALRDGPVPPRRRPAKVRTARPVHAARAARPVLVACALRTGADGSPATVGVPALHARGDSGKALVDGVVPREEADAGEGAGRRVRPVPGFRAPGSPGTGFTAEDDLPYDVPAPLERRAPPPAGTRWTGPAGGGAPVHPVMTAVPARSPARPRIDAAPGHPDHWSWADPPTPHCRSRRTGRRGVAGEKLAGIQRHLLPIPLALMPLVPMWTIL